MKKFLVLYLVPASVLEDWSKTDPEKRKMAEEKMRGDWNKWMSNHAKMITDTGAGGKTKRVSSSGTMCFSSQTDLMGDTAMVGVPSSPYLAKILT